MFRPFSYTLGNIFNSMPWSLRWLYFTYDLLVISNQAPIFFWFLLFGFTGFFMNRFIHFYVALPFLILSLYNFILFLLDYYFYVHKKTADEEMPKVFGDDKTNIEVAATRTSVRAYQKKYLTEDDEEFVKTMLKERSVGNVQFLYLKYEFRVILVTDCYQYCVVLVPKKFSHDEIVYVGEALQDVVLACTRRGIGTCWVGGFQGNCVSAQIPKFDKNKDHVAVLCAIGYESKYVPKLIRDFGKISRSRLENSELFFDKKWGNPLNIENLDENWKDVLENVRWAPSGGNHQFTRIIRDGGKFHFYKHGQSNYYAIIGIGISKSQWKMGCDEVGIEGEFIKEDPSIKVPEFTTYFCTFVVKE